MCSGRQSLFWPGTGFTEIKESLCGGQRASASRQIKAALEAEWAQCGRGLWGNGPAGDMGGRFHIQNTHGLVINAPISTLGARSAGLLEAPVPPIAGPGSLSAPG